MAFMFTSDTHYHHFNIIEYCKRPYKSLDEMNEDMIAKWNERVTPDDTVYHLGDFSFGKKERIAEVRARLNGKIILIKGNHDRNHEFMIKSGFQDSFDEFEFHADHVTHAILRHHPPMNNSWHKGNVKYFLHGHVHERWARQGPVINVGVDVRGFRPVTFKELLDP